jgi:tetraacyldisaccharide 4'-kinase
LLPVSFIYGAGVALRNQAFEAGILPVTRIGVPVVSVGNLVVGGTGKTPMVEYVGAYYVSKGITVGVVSRGYGRKSRGVVVVSEGGRMLAGFEEGGDEPTQIARKLKGGIVVVGENRVKAGKTAAAKGAEIVIADDGFQHRYLGRCLNILMVDINHDLRSEHLLPAGFLREPLSSASRADVLVLTGNDPHGTEPSWISGFLSKLGKPVARTLYVADHLHRVADGIRLKEIPPGGALLFSGIGRHEKFVATAEEAGISVRSQLRFPDHHVYTHEDEQNIIEQMKKTGTRTCVTTEKDVCRMRREGDGTVAFLKGHDLLYLPVTLKVIDGEPLLHEKLDQCLNRTGVA